MSDFVEPISKEVTFTLRKSLLSNEEICPTCKGLGFLIADNPFGLKDDSNKIIWYKNQAIQPCWTCYNGTVKKCKYCGNIIPKGRLKCTCKDQRRTDLEEEVRIEKERLDKAEIAPAEQFDMYYSDWYSNDNGYFSEFEEFFDEWLERIYDGDNTDDERPEFVYGTVADNLHIDAYSIVESACEDMYEDAMCDTDDKSIQELQDYLDDWCAHCGIGTTYYYDKNYKVRIPWEDIDI